MRKMMLVKKKCIGIFLTLFFFTYPVMASETPSLYFGLDKAAGLCYFVSKGNTIKLSGSELYFKKKNTNDAFVELYGSDSFSGIQKFVIDFEYIPVKTDVALRLFRASSANGGYNFFYISSNGTLHAGAISVPISEQTKIALCVDLSEKTGKLYINEEFKGNIHYNDLSNHFVIQSFRLGMETGGSETEFFIKNIKIYSGAEPYSSDEFSCEKNTISIMDFEDGGDKAASYIGGNVVFSQKYFFADGKKQSYTSDNTRPYLDEGVLMIPSEMCTYIKEACVINDNKISFAGASMEVGKNICKTPDGGTITLKGNPCIINDVLFLPAKDICEIAGLCTYYDKRGFVIAGKNPLSYQDSKDPYNNTERIDTVYRYMHFDRPSGNQVVTMVKNAYTDNSPRLLITKDRVTRIKENITTDSVSKNMYNKLIHEAELIPEACVEYKIDGFRLFDSCITVKNRILTLSSAYMITSDRAKKEKYASKIWAEMQNALNWKDWNTSAHFLDSGKIAVGIAVGYDTLRDYLNTTQKRWVREKVYELYLDFCTKAYLGRYQGTEFRYAQSNWGSVCAGAILTMCISFAPDAENEFRDVLEYLIENSMHSLEYPVGLLHPDGAWHEGVGYWGYVAEYLTSYCVGVLQNTCGEDFGFSSSEGYFSAFDFMLGINGPCGVFNYSDCSERSTPYYIPQGYQAALIGNSTERMSNQYLFREAFNNADNVQNNLIFTDMTKVPPNFPANGTSANAHTDNLWNSITGQNSKWNEPRGAKLYILDSFSDGSEEYTGKFLKVAKENGKSAELNLQSDTFEAMDSGIIRVTYDVFVTGNITRTRFSFTGLKSEGASGSKYYDMRNFVDNKWNKLTLDFDLDKDRLYYTRTADGEVAWRDDTGVSPSEIEKVNQFRLVFLSDDDIADQAYIIKSITVEHMTSDYEGDALDLLWYEPDLRTNNEISLAKDMYFKGEGIGIMRDSWYTQNGAFVGVKAGFNKSEGGHFDKGTFVYDWGGVRWATDLGRENNAIPGYYSTEGNRLYRNRAEGHNVVVINPDSATAGQLCSSEAYLENLSSSAADSYMIYNLSDVYADNTNGYKRGFYLGDNRESLTIRDEISLKDTSEIYWFMHTRAKITLDEDRKGATLFSDGQKLRVTAHCSSDNWFFEERKPEPFDISMKHDNEFTVAGINKLALYIAASGDVNITVKLAPVDSEKYAATDIPLSQWTLKDGEAPYELKMVSPSISELDENGKTKLKFRIPLYSDRARLYLNDEFLEEKTNFGTSEDVEFLIDSKSIEYLNGTVKLTVEKKGKEHIFDSPFILNPTQTETLYFSDFTNIEEGKEISYLQTSGFDHVKQVGGSVELQADSNAVKIVANNSGNHDNLYLEKLVDVKADEKLRLSFDIISRDGIKMYFSALGNDDIAPTPNMIPIPDGINEGNISLVFDGNHYQITVVDKENKVKNYSGEYKINGFSMARLTFFADAESKEMKIDNYLIQAIRHDDIFRKLKKNGTHLNLYLSESAKRYSIFHAKYNENKMTDIKAIHYDNQKFIELGERYSSKVFVWDEMMPVTKCIQY